MLTLVLRKKIVKHSIEYLTFRDFKKLNFLNFFKSGKKLPKKVIIKISNNFDLLGQRKEEEKSVVFILDFSHGITLHCFKIQSVVINTAKLTMSPILVECDIPKTNMQSLGEKSNFSFILLLYFLVGLFRFFV